MATLNIKNFPISLANRLKKRASQQHRSVAQEVIHLLKEALKEPKQHSILELRELGKGRWNSIDATSHIKKERETWD